MGGAASAVMRELHGSVVVREELKEEESGHAGGTAAWEHPAVPLNELQRTLGVSAAPCSPTPDTAAAAAEGRKEGGKEGGKEASQ